MADSQNSLERRLIQLEEYVAHQDRTLEQLNEVVLELRGEIVRLKLRMDEQLQRLQERVDGLSDGPLPHEKPPHY